VCQVGRGREARQLAAFAVVSLPAEAQAGTTSIIAVTFLLVNGHHNLMGDGRTEVVLLWETRAMSEQNLLVLAGSVPAGNVTDGRAPGSAEHPAKHHHHGHNMRLYKQQQ
jgi:hypothetical protein